MIGVQYSLATKKLRIEGIHRLHNSDGLDEEHIERELGWME
jgi:hypothetical protein